METPCTSLRDPAGSGNLSIGRDEPSLPSAESPNPGEIDTVVHDIVHPRDDCGEHASLPGQFPSREHGLVSLTDPPRDRHMLLEERPNLQRSSVLPHGIEIPTIWPPKRAADAFFDSQACFKTKYEPVVVVKWLIAP